MKAKDRSFRTESKLRQAGVVEARHQAPTHITTQFSRNKTMESPNTGVRTISLMIILIRGKVLTFNMLVLTITISGACHLICKKVSITLKKS